MPALSEARAAITITREPNERQVSTKVHLHRYFAEFDMRYSTKTATDGERAALILKGMEGRRLTYRPTNAVAA